MYIGDWMARGARYWPDHTAVVDVARELRLTYTQMNRRANDLAGWLQRAGVVRGDRVAILAPNGVEVLDLLFACAKLGAVFVPLNWRSHWRELAAMLQRLTPTVLVYSDDFNEAAAAVHAAVPAAEQPRVWLRIDAGFDPTHPTYASALAGDGTPVSNPAVDGEDTLCLLFTGGTTGAPKAAQIPYRMVAWNTLNTLIHELRPGDVTITHTPMFHTGGLFVYTIPLLTLGGTVVLMRKWTAADMLALIAKEQVTALFCVPTQYQMMLDTPQFRTTSLASLRFLTSGGAPLPVPLIHAYREIHGVAFKQGFGMTEFGPGIFSMPPERAEDKAGSVGQANYFIDARIVDEHGTVLGPDQVGELVVKGPCACSGYYGDPEATAAAFDAAGYFHTGDLARADADGFYYIVDRKKDMFISGGENVYPAEIEAVLYKHASVAQAAVVAHPDPQWGEVGRAVVALRPGTTATVEALLDHCRAHLARYKVPKLLELRDALPLSPAGKILKRAL